MSNANTTTEIVPPPAGTNPAGGQTVFEHALSMDSFFDVSETGKSSSPIFFHNAETPDLYSFPDESHRMTLTNGGLCAIVKYEYEFTPPH